MHHFSFFRWVKFVVVVLGRFFLHLAEGREGGGGRGLVALDRWSSYAIMIVWELAWVESTLVILDEYSSYRGCRLSRFDCISK